MPSVLEELQRTSEAAEIWWDSSPLDFAGWRDRHLATAPDATTRERWREQLQRFLCPATPQLSLARGVTTNPSLVAQSVLASPECWGKDVRRLIRSQAAPDVASTFSLLYEEALRRAAREMLPMWEASKGRYGWVSGQLDPRRMFDTDLTLEQAMSIAGIAPNLMVKVPGTQQGYAAIRYLVGRGISVNSTLSYTVPQFVACAEAVEAGLRKAKADGVDTRRWRAVFTHMIGRFGANTDLRHEAAIRDIELSQTDLRWAEVAILKRIHTLVRTNGHPVKPLLSSLEVDDPTLGSSTLSMHLEQSAGGAVAYTCKPRFIADVMIRENELPAFDARAIEGEVPGDVLAKLSRLPSFQRAYAPDGMRPEEFCHYGSFISTYSEVMGNTRKLIDFVAHQFQRAAPLDRPLLPL
ncbi:transaldolase family protein [Streptomyces cavourensis]|uniref:transaldolase family protein n=1 Tax=Streptomyces cavourensis TaxID=67258 RepID=UPI001C948C00|nr:transaldolase family protein [Streptomyces cavourensis]